MGEYPGQVMHERFPRGRKGGSLHVSAYGMVFDTGEERIAIPLEGLGFSVGGSGNRLTYLQTPGLPGYSFYTTDRAVLREPIFQQHADVAAGCARPPPRTAAAMRRCWSPWRSPP